MESATLRRAPSEGALIRAGAVASLLAVAVAAWALTADRMGGMDAGPGTDLGSIGWFIVAWVTMMAAMMLPAITPTVVAFAGSEQGRGARLPATGAAALFIAGYLVSWMIAGLLGYMVVEGVRSLDIGFLAWASAGPYVAGGVLLGAALYQLIPQKGACLRGCRRPLMLLGGRPGRLGVLRTGFEHGRVCVGCCWALMAALFALGVMSMGWMALIAALIAAERLLPWRRIAVRVTAVLLAALAIGVALAPQEVPGLTIPGSPEAAQTMEAMEGMGGSVAPGAGAASGRE